MQIQHHVAVIDQGRARGEDDRGGRGRGGRRSEAEAIDDQRNEDILAGVNEASIREFIFIQETGQTMKD